MSGLTNASNTSAADLRISIPVAVFGIWLSCRLSINSIHNRPEGGIRRNVFDICINFPHPMRLVFREHNGGEHHNPFGQWRVSASDSPVSSRLLRLARMCGQSLDTASINFDSGLSISGITVRFTDLPSCSCSSL